MTQIDQFQQDQNIELAKKMPRAKSYEIFEKLCEVIPGGVNSPVRACSFLDGAPLVAKSAFEDIVVDADDNSFIDYCGSWGALIHGACHPGIIKTAKEQIDQGSSFGITTEIEEKMAKKICSLVPSVEKIRFVSSGTESTMSAARLARGFTKKELIVKFAGNYHGHADFFLVKAGSGVASLKTSSSAGIPKELVEHTICLPYNDVEALLSFFNNPTYKNKIAGVILEPIAGNMGVVPATPQFIKTLEEETKKCGALLIFDEVITGFRVGLKGAQGLYGVKPDLTCFGKIIGGGFPAAAFGGRKEVMDFLSPIGDVYQAGTLSGNPVAMSAGLKALELLEISGFYEELKRKTDLLTNPIKEFIQEKDLNICLQQEGSMFTLFFGLREVCNMDDAMRADKEEFKRFFRYMFENGVYIPPLQMESWFVSNAHTEENLEKTCKLILNYI
ncbi:MAG TPA: glutamate-1-semialdehyde 2,1-aminomutase [Parachlamydiaceae bacterium]|nr:glutamate-1-semialdehyde 2,1-aminomutase [Parachlamydiaceae bacterium]